MGDTGRIPALDGLRGVAILLVVASHAGVPGFLHGGEVGVTVFFVLSGYLITGILLRRPTLRAFYVRRAARLLPALAVLLLALGVVEVARGLGTEYGQAGLLTALYASNWAGQLGVGMGPLTHTWSLAVEEQFYVVWPWLLLLTPRRALPGVLLGLVAASLGLRLAMSGDVDRVYTGTDTNVYALAAGGLLAVAPSLREAPRWAVWCGGAVIAVATSAPAAGFVWPPTVGAVGAVLVLWSCVTRPLVPPRWLAFCGAVSYGWYLWHGALAYVVEGRTVGVPDWRVGVPSVLVGLGVAVLSLRWVEMPVRSRARGQSPAAVLCASSRVEDRAAP